MSRYRLLAVDVDGTLVNSQDELTPATREALVGASAAEVQVVVATGRRYSRTLHLVEPLGIDVPLVTASGALVKDPTDHRTLYRAQFRQGVLAKVVQLVDRCGFEPVLCADTYANGFDYYHARDDVDSPELAEFLRLNSNCGRLWPELIRDPPPGVFAGFTMGTQAEMLRLEQELQRRLPRQLYTHVLRSPRYVGYMCEIAPSGATKWSAVRRLATQWGITAEAICAVGDDINDVPMIRGAGLGVAMGNALPAVKAAADRIAPTHDEDGLVQVVRWLLN